MAGRSTEDVKRELQSEREHLGSAVEALRSRADRLRRKLPVLAVGAAGAGLVLRTAAKRVSRRKAAGRDKRGRFSLTGRD
jgi:hypothetical protein